MKRDSALVSLSRDHHHTLWVALRLRRATPETAAEVRNELIAYWMDHGRVHFRQEEEILLPAYAAHGDPYHPLVARALCDHISIRQAVDGIMGDDASTATALHDLGQQLYDHVRLEERELFLLIERAMPAAALTEVAQALGMTEGKPPDG